MVDIDVQYSGPHETRRRPNKLSGKNCFSQILYCNFIFIFLFIFILRRHIISSDATIQGKVLL